MRERISRGKRIDNGEWVYGYFWSNDVGNSFIRVTKENDEIVLKDYEVSPETVGDYTGLTDKNGKKIFEGDILSDGGDTYKVIFDEGVFQIDNSHYITGLYVAIHMEKIDEVIGNIHDNPELLEDEQ